jgi:gliding motility-associated-like protein
MKKMNLLLGTILCFTTFAYHGMAQSKVAIDVEDKEVESTKILIPTAFSPNNDGINDVFKLENVGKEQLIEFRVFNRWGTIMFSTKDIHRGWDGVYKGEVQPVGIYGYIVQIKLPDGREELYRGTVTLVK